ncbi:hypothetical protein WM014_08620 [Bifidobacterium mongoliense]|uniref:antitoxin VbhA family protein n=1 Tax=Bifidobacterium mongoliense TaxID=518643 RepID=UPI0030ECED11
MDERTRRSLVIRDGMHSAELEGGRVTDAYRRDAQDYIDGHIDEDGLIRRTRARYGLETI